MVVLNTCKNEEDRIRTEDARVLTRLYVIFSDAQGQLTPKSAMEFLPKFKLVQDFMGIFSDAQGQLTPKSLVEPG